MDFLILIWDYKFSPSVAIDRRDREVEGGFLPLTFPQTAWQKGYSRTGICNDTSSNSNTQLFWKYIDLLAAKSEAMCSKNPILFPSRKKSNLRVLPWVGQKFERSAFQAWTQEISQQKRKLLLASPSHLSINWWLDRDSGRRGSGLENFRPLSKPRTTGG
jgi:hypothetical protein